MEPAAGRPSSSPSTDARLPLLSSKSSRIEQQATAATLPPYTSGFRRLRPIPHRQGALPQAEPRALRRVLAVRGIAACTPRRLFSSEEEQSAVLCSVAQVAGGTGRDTGLSPRALSSPPRGRRPWPETELPAAFGGRRCLAGRLPPQVHPARHPLSGLSRGRGRSPAAATREGSEWSAVCTYAQSRGGTSPSSCAGFGQAVREILPGSVHLIRHSTSPDPNLGRVPVS